jgi:hypothetical protein
VVACARPPSCSILTHPPLLPLPLLCLSSPHSLSPSINNSSLSVVLWFFRFGGTFLFDQQQPDTTLSLCHKDKEERTTATLLHRMMQQ